MRGRKPAQLKLKRKDQARLHELLGDDQTPLRVARRAQVLLSRANDQRGVGVLGELVERDASTLWRICERYRHSGLQAALYDAPRSGRPPVFFQHCAPGP